MISASSAWIAAHQELLLPEMFIELDYTVSEPGLQEDAVASSNDDTSFSTVADVVSMEEKSGAKYAILEHGLWGLDGNYPYFNSPANPGYVSQGLSGADCFFTERPKIINMASSTNYGIAIEHGSVLNTINVPVTVNNCGRAAVMCTYGSTCVLSNIQGSGNTNFGLAATLGGIIAYQAKTITGTSGDYSQHGGRIFSGTGG